MKLIILDRDGVINHDSDAYIKSPDEWRPIPGSLQAIARLTNAGWRITVATNQSGVARGLFDLATLGAIHSKMHQAVGEAGGRIDAVFFCPHAAGEDCSCRKPAPGLLEQICDRYGVERNEVRVVGSCEAHLQAGAALGAQLHLVCTGQSAALRPGGALPAGLPAGTQLHASLADFVDQLLPVAPGATGAVGTVGAAPLPLS